MARSPDPLNRGDIDFSPENLRYGGPVSNSGETAERYKQHHDTDGQHRGQSGTYNFMGTTLEEEAENNGWRFGDRPSTSSPVLQGPDARLSRDAGPRQLLTIGMRGEPGYDDDPQYTPDGQWTHESGYEQGPSAGVSGNVGED